MWFNHGIGVTLLGIRSRSTKSTFYGEGGIVLQNSLKFSYAGIIPSTL